MTKSIIDEVSQIINGISRNKIKSTAAKKDGEEGNASSLYDMKAVEAHFEDLWKQWYGFLESYLAKREDVLRAEDLGMNDKVSALKFLKGSSNVELVYKINGSTAGLNSDSSMTILNTRDHVQVYATCCRQPSLLVDKTSDSDL